MTREDTRPEKGCGCSSSVSASASVRGPGPGVCLPSSITARLRKVSTKLTWRDHFGTLRARWAIGRMSYTVRPGLYSVGQPTGESPVFVSANYKLSFDHLRSNLHGVNAWLLVLDTKGINVWCAAGKGTFGTKEIVRLVKAASLDKVVSHRKLIVPQLGAPGVSAHEVLAQCGFRVIYGPVRARDIPAFLSAEMKTTPEMRRVVFSTIDRAVLIPVELVMGLKYAIGIAAVLLTTGGLSRHGYSLTGMQTTGLGGAIGVFSVFAGATVLGPILLPWLPGRAFSIKGAILGAVFAAVTTSSFVASGSVLPVWHLGAWIASALSITSFVVMNFTGSTTFTSLSGVLAEMRIAIPIQGVVAFAALVFWFVGLFANRGGA